MKLYRSDEGFINYQIKNTFIYKYRLFWVRGLWRQIVILMWNNID